MSRELAYHAMMVALVAGLTILLAWVEGASLARCLVLGGLALCVSVAAPIASGFITIITCTKGLLPCFPTFLALWGALLIAGGVAIWVLGGWLPALPVAIHGAFVVALSISARGELPPC